MKACPNCGHIYSGPYCKFCEERVRSGGVMRGDHG